MQIIVSPMAAHDYREKVAQHLTYDEAIRELEGLAESAEIVEGSPAWVLLADNEYGVLARVREDLYLVCEGARSVVARSVLVKP